MIDDLWTIVDPPPWAVFLPGIVATGPTSVTLRLAVRPDAETVSFPRLTDTESLAVVEERFRVDREMGRLHHIPRSAP